MIPIILLAAATAALPASEAKERCVNGTVYEWDGWVWRSDFSTDSIALPKHMGSACVELPAPKGTKLELGELWSSSSTKLSPDIIVAQQASASENKMKLDVLDVRARKLQDSADMAVITICGFICLALVFVLSYIAVVSYNLHKKLDSLIDEPDPEDLFDASA